MIKETLICDMCGKEVRNLNTMIVLFGRHGLKVRDFTEYSKYRAVYNHEICDKCVGSPVFDCHGDTPPTSIKDKGMKFIKKLLRYT